MEAVATLKKIEDSIFVDQGNAYRRFLGVAMPKMSDAYRENASSFRSHLGASLIGGECARALWYGFRWVTQPVFSARILRLFNRGHLEEARFIAMLQSAGFEVWCEDSGNQFRISEHRGHFGGSLDSIVRGLPECPDEPCLAEFKTHSRKSFTKLVAEGLQCAKWQHYVQMQIYMFKMGLKKGLYMAVCKDDDKMYAEIVAIKEDLAIQYLQRAYEIITATTPPTRISNTPSRFECKYCSHKAVCFGKEAPLSHCRTCQSAEMHDKGQWFCSKFNQKIDKTKQEEGCDSHSFLESL